MRLIMFNGIIELYNAMNDNNEGFKIDKNSNEYYILLIFSKLILVTIIIILLNILFWII